MSILAFSSVTKGYGSFNLGPLDLVIDSGVTALLGANGAGKTTLLRAVVGSVSLDKGTVLVDGEAPGRIPGGIGYLPQDFAGPKNVRVCDYLMFIAWCRSRKGSHVDAGHVERALDRVGLLSRQNDKIRTLSGGMVRRVGIAQALLGESGVLALDEPTVGLDPIQRRELRDVLDDLGRDRTVLLSTHLSEDVAAVASRVIVLDGGAVAFAGPVDELVALGGGKQRTGMSVEAGFLATIDRELARST